jgi:phage gp36-like protein
MLINTFHLFSCIHQEYIEEITRDNQNIVESAIASAIEEVKLYLSKYDLVALFGTSELPPTTESTLLKTYCARVACWNLVNLANPNVMYDHIEVTYKQTIEQLKMIQSGKSTPEDWPYRPEPQQNIPDGDSVIAKYRPRNNNYFY